MGSGYSGCCRIQYGRDVQGRAVSRMVGEKETGGLESCIYGEAQSEWDGGRDKYRFMH